MAIVIWNQGPDDKTGTTTVIKTNGDGRRRSVGKGENPPEVYTPPDITKVPPPIVTNRLVPERARSNSAREITLGAVEGVRWWEWGRQQIPLTKVQYTKKSGTNEIWIVFEICKGECDSLVQINVNNVWYPAFANVVGANGFQFYWYAGTPAGQVDANLAAVDATWNEAFAGTCHGVLHLMALDKHWPQMPSVIVEQKCYKPIDPRTDTRAYSENVFVQWYDWLMDPEGRNLPGARINKQSFIDAANIADEMVGSPARKRFESHLSLRDEHDLDDVEKAFRLMSDSWCFWENNQKKVIVDRPRTAVATYGASNLSSSAEPRGARDDDFQRPNTIYVEITDTTTTSTWQPKLLGPFQTAAAIAGTEAEVPYTYKMPWIHDAGTGTSRGTYILNAFQYDFHLFIRWNETTSDRVLGDPITQNVPSRGLNVTGVLVARTKTFEKNIYDAVILERNAALYSDDVATIPAKTPSTLPDPADVPPNIGAPTITEELFQPQPGFFTPRAKIAITNPDFYFLDAVELWYSINAGEYRYYGKFAGGSAASVFMWFDSINEIGVPYSFKFISVSSFGPKSSGTIATYTFQGKTTSPADVPSLTVGANGNDALMWWQPSSDIDIVQYELRRGKTTDTWSTAVLVKQVKELHWTDTPPFGTWRYFVKAIDYAGRYSTNAATGDVTIGPIGQPTPTEVHSRLTPDDAVFPPSVTSTGSPPALRKGSGNLIVEGDVGTGTATVNPGEGTTPTMGYARVLLSRLTSPAAAETERAAGGYTVGGWATSIDDPRRNGAPIWAPLPANANGEIYGGPGIARLSEVRVGFLSVLHQGTDTPGRIAFATPFMRRASDGSKQYGDAFIGSPKFEFREGGIRLSTNSPTYQIVVLGVPEDLFFSPVGYSRVSAIFSSVTSTKRYVVKQDVAQTDGSGLFAVTFTYDAYPDAPTRVFDITAMPSGGGYVVTALSVTGSGTSHTVTFKSYNATDGSAAANVKFGYKIEDAGGNTSGATYAT